MCFVYARKKESVKPRKYTPPTHQCIHQSACGYTEVLVDTPKCLWIWIREVSLIRSGFKKINTCVKFTLI